MAHVARLDENNFVVDVIVIHNDYDKVAEDFAASLYGGTWVQTSYNANIRGKFAGIGDFYDKSLDVFIAPITNDKPNELLD